jgi:hypothetical protein
LLGSRSGEVMCSRPSCSKPSVKVVGGGRTCYLIG